MCQRWPYEMKLSRYPDRMKNLRLRGLEGVRTKNVRWTTFFSRVMVCRQMLMQRTFNSPAASPLVDSWTWRTWVTSWTFGRWLKYLLSSSASRFVGGAACLFNGEVDAHCETLSSIGATVSNRLELNSQSILKLVRSAAGRIEYLQLYLRRQGRYILCP